MLPPPVYSTREWPVQGAREFLRVLLIQKSDEAFYTSLLKFTGGEEWEHVKDSAVWHIKLTEAEDRVEMLLQGGWKVLLEAS
jgi:hypothetical protein